MFVIKLSPLTVMFGSTVMAIAKAMFFKIWLSSYLTGLTEKIDSQILRFTISQANNWKLWVSLRMCLKTVSYKSMPLQSSHRYNSPAETVWEGGWTWSHRPCWTDASHSFLPDCGMVIISLHSDCKIISVWLYVIFSLFYIEGLVYMCNLLK